MVSKMIVALCIQALILQACWGQVISRYGGCGCGGSPYGYSEVLPGPVVYDQPTTIIQDSTVANNLANALQLLVVSNLLSSTLPLEPACDLVAPVAPLGALAPLGQYASLGQYAPLGPLAPLTQYAPASLVSPCGCGGCGCGCGCQQYPYNIIY